MMLLADYESEHLPRSSTGIPLVEALDPKNVGLFSVDVIDDFSAEALAVFETKYRKQYGKDFDLSHKRFRVYLPD